MIEVREASPDDRDFLANLSLVASREHTGWGMYDAIFLRPDEEILEVLRQLAVTETPYIHHWRRRMIAEVDGVPVGAISGAVNDNAFRAAFASSLLEVFDAGELARLAPKRAPWANCLVNPPDGGWSIDLLGVVPWARGRGVGQALLAASLRQAEAAGCTTASVTFVIGNQAAAALAANAGFHRFAERRDFTFEQRYRAPGLVHARRRLSGAGLPPLP